MPDDAWDDAKELGNLMWQRFKKATSGAAESADRRLKVTRLRRQIKKLASQRHDVHQQIGEKVYQLHQKGKVRNKDILEDCRQIDDLRERIESLEDEIRQLQTQEDDEEPALEDEDFLTEDEDSGEGEVVEVEPPDEDIDTGREAQADQSEDSETVIDVTVTSSRDMDDEESAPDTTEEDTATE